jgi:hypothetical protein
MEQWPICHIPKYQTRLEKPKSWTNTLAYFMQKTLFPYFNIDQPESNSMYGAPLIWYDRNSQI